MSTERKADEGNPSAVIPGTSSDTVPPTDPSEKKDLKKKVILALGALGVVYGDIGTSPLYTVKECFHGPHAMSLTHANILGVMSLIFWSLTVVVTIKYVIFILKADNHGEGGIYALAALFLGKGRQSVSPGTVNRLVLLAIFGAALLYGDGIITPVISVLSAVEGLNVATTAAEPFVLPISCVVLMGLFLFQSQGTERIGQDFRPHHDLLVCLLSHPGIDPDFPDAGDSGGPGPASCRDLFCHQPPPWYGGAGRGGALSSPGARRYMRTWAISAAALSGSPGWGWCFRRSC